MPSSRCFCFVAILAGAFAISTSAKEPADGMPSWSDPAFDAIVSPAEIEEAMAILAPDKLTALAEKLAAAEKTVKRAHKKLSASAAIKMALRSATSKRHIASLDRLVKLGEALDNDVVIQTAKIARNASRAPRSELNLALDQIPPEEFAQIRGMLAQIHSARTLEDRDALEQVGKRIKAHAFGEERIREHLTKHVTDALKSMPAKADPDMVAARETKKDVDAAVSKTDTPAKEDHKEDPKVEAKDPPKIDPPKNLAEFAKLLTEHGLEAMTDDGFEGKIDLTKIAKAFAKSDAAGLTDHAFRMADEESKLSRPHKFIPAELLFKGSMGLAILGGDQKTLDRLEKGLKNRPGQEDLVVKLVASRQLASGSRKGNKPLMESPEDVSLESFNAFRFCLSEIDSATKGQDAASLAALENGLPFIAELNAGQRSHLSTLIASARKNIPEQPDESVEVLRLLGQSASRGEQTKLSLNVKLLAHAQAHTNKTAGDGKNGTFIRSGLSAYGAKIPATDNGDWGKKIDAASVQAGEEIPQGQFPRHHESRVADFAAVNRASPTAKLRCCPASCRVWRGTR